MTTRAQWALLIGFMALLVLLTGAVLFGRPFARLFVLGVSAWGFLLGWAVREERGGR